MKTVLMMYMALQGFGMDATRVAEFPSNEACLAALPTISSLTLQKDVPPLFDKTRCDSSCPRQDVRCRDQQPVTNRGSAHLLSKIVGSEQAIKGRSTPKQLGNTAASSVVHLIVPMPPFLIDKLSSYRPISLAFYSGVQYAQTSASPFLVPHVLLPLRNSLLSRLDRTLAQGQLWLAITSIGQTIQQSQQGDTASCLESTA